MSTAFAFLLFTALWKSGIGLGAALCLSRMLRNRSADCAAGVVRAIVACLPVPQRRRCCHAGPRWPRSGSVSAGRRILWNAPCYFTGRWRHRIRVTEPVDAPRGFTWPDRRPGVADPDGLVRRRGSAADALCQPPARAPPAPTGLGRRERHCVARECGVVRTARSAVAHRFDWSAGDVGNRAAGHPGSDRFRRSARGKPGCGDPPRAGPHSGERLSDARPGGGRLRVDLVSAPCVGRAAAIARRAGVGVRQLRSGGGWQAFDLREAIVGLGCPRRNGLSSRGWNRAIRGWFCLLLVQVGLALRARSRTSAMGGLAAFRSSSASA